METSKTELEKLTKQKLIEIIHERDETLAMNEECGDLLRRDSGRY